MSIKIKTYEQLKADHPHPERFVVVSENGKMICDCFGKGFLTRASAYYGFLLFTKRWNQYKGFARKQKYETQHINL